MQLRARAPPIRVEALAVAARMGARPRTAVGGAVLVVLVLAAASYVRGAASRHVGEARAAAAFDAAADALRLRLVPGVRGIRVVAKATRRRPDRLAFGRGGGGRPINKQPLVLLLDCERLFRELLHALGSGFTGQ